ncbi:MULTISPECIES: arylesterase [unclassified Paracoccus (in: a-proteobacteria)]|uniref:arylesterase n=1 Tax=unclassified Paracoccus (in: a-proteobacteria) TaxID=2688777 RepID=UPI0021E18457|nr:MULTISPECIES: arylesterase [unclassified Paracoccus (in: a-proteobacteria)]UXU75321.1 arylesterase [Paracoccus sp. SMMA_5]UXU81224.1 arylesterase [Paracoccus sp. SMMA_5_TC]
MRLRRRLIVLMLAPLLTLAPAVALAQAPAPPLRVLVFGDSLTEGYGLPRKDGLVPQLQAWLDRRGQDATVLNGGLSGDTTAGGRVRIGYSIARHRPDAVVVELGGNDLLLGFGPAMVEDNLDSILTQAARRDRPLLLVGIALPDAGARDIPASDSTERAAWAAIWPRLADRHRALLLPNLFQPLYDAPEDYRAYLQADGLHPSARGVREIVEVLGPKVEELIAETRRRRALADAQPETDLDPADGG